NARPTTTTSVKNNSAPMMVTILARIPIHVTSFFVFVRDAADRFTLTLLRSAARKEVGELRVSNGILSRLLMFNRISTRLRPLLLIKPNGHNLESHRSECFPPIQFDFELRVAAYRDDVPARFISDELGRHQRRAAPQIQCPH